jgi:hypothetical protein
MHLFFEDLVNALEPAKGHMSQPHVVQCLLTLLTASQEKHVSCSF